MSTTETNNELMISEPHLFISFIYIGVIYKNKTSFDAILYGRLTCVKYFLSLFSIFWLCVSTYTVNKYVYKRLKADEMWSLI